MTFEIIAFKDLDGIHWKDQAGYFWGMGMTEEDMLKNKAAIYAVRGYGEIFTRVMWCKRENDDSDYDHSERYYSGTGF